MPKFVRCVEGHVFDLDVVPSCPSCGASIQSGPGTQTEDLKPAAPPARNRVVLGATVAALLVGGAVLFLAPRPVPIPAPPPAPRIMPKPPLYAVPPPDTVSSNPPSGAHMAANPPAPPPAQPVPAPPHYAAMQPPAPGPSPAPRPSPQWPVHHWPATAATQPTYEGLASISPDTTAAMIVNGRRVVLAGLTGWPDQVGAARLFLKTITQGSYHVRCAAVSAGAATDCRAVNTKQSVAVGLIFNGLAGAGWGAPSDYFRWQAAARKAHRGRWAQYR